MDNDICYVWFFEVKMAFKASVGAMPMCFWASLVDFFANVRYLSSRDSLKCFVCVLFFAMWYLYVTWIM